MIKVMLLDDEEHALENLDMTLKEAGGIERISAWQCPDRFLDELQRLEELDSLPDVVFIDIEMPETNGLEVAETVKERYPEVEVVFVTAYSEYAVQAFELHSLDYVLKPASRKRLMKTLARLQTTGSKPQKARKRGTLRVQAMGEFALIDQHQSEQLRWRTRKVKELCACLLHNHQRAVTTLELIERLYPESDSERAKVLVYTSMSYLRKSLKELGYSEAIRKHDNGYRFYLAEGMQWDVLDLLLILDELEASEAPPDWHTVKKLMAVYQGDYFYQIEQPEFVLQRLELRNRTLRVIRAAKERYRLEGDRQRQLDCAAQLFQLSPESESTALELMQLYAERGSHAEMLKIYERYVHYARDELGLAPSDQLVDYVRTVLGDAGSST